MQGHWRRVRGMTLGVQGLVFNERGEIALVRHTYRPGWHFPGGGVERGETLRAALDKELREEAGVQLTGPAHLFALYSNEAKFRGDHIALYVVKDWQACEPDHRGEIAETRWCRPGALPADTSVATRRRIGEVLDGVPVSETW
jgi:ADP-ribose pyrophosphatase YjhB (NUDIX family)